LKEMKKHLDLPTLLALVFASAALVTLGAQGKSSGGSEKLLRMGARAIPGHYIVVFNEGASAPAPGGGGRIAPGDHAGALGRAQELTRGTNAVPEFVYSAALQGFTARMSEPEAIALSRDPRVAFVEEDSIVEALVTQTNAPWGLDRIDQRNLPLSTTYTYTTTGSGVNAYVIDTGIRTTHTQFGGRAVAAFTSINDGGGAQDCNGHGTHLAGIIGGSTYGVAKRARLHAVRVLSCTGSGSTSGVIAGIDFVRTNAVRPAVVNMSLGGAPSTALDNAVNNAINAGLTVVVSAGSSNSNAANSSPARVAAAITVGASTSADARAPFSNFGAIVDLFAPGVSITSAWHTSDTATRTLSGTSMATAHVAGVAARQLQTTPGASPAAVRNRLVADATLNVLTGIPAGTANRLVFRGGTQ
jgi:aqualysin 1